MHQVWIKTFCIRHQLLSEFSFHQLPENFHNNYNNTLLDRCGMGQEWPHSIVFHCVQHCEIGCFCNIFVEFSESNLWIFILKNQAWLGDRSKWKSALSEFKCGFIRGPLVLGGDTKKLFVFRCFYMDTVKCSEVMWQQYTPNKSSMEERGRLLSH